MTETFTSDHGHLRIGDVTERTGLSVHALRYYEREGILPDAVNRTPDGRRLYSERDVDWITNCTKFRASGMSIDTIRRFAQLVRDGSGNEQQRLDLLREHQQVVIDRISELTSCLELITQKVAAYEAGLEAGVADLWHGSQP